jgi:replicative DNA helicase
MDDRPAPHDELAEKAVLGAMLADARAAGVAAELLQAGDFFAASRGLIFKVITDVYNTGTTPDEVVIRNEIETRGLTQRVGGLAVIGDLIEAFPASSNVEQYCRILRQKAEARAVISAAGEITRLGFGDEPLRGTSIAEQAEALIYGITERWTSGDNQPKELADVLKEAFSAKRKVPVSTEYDDLDKLLGGGLHPGEMVIVAGRPSMGKTTFALNICRQAAAKNKTACAIFSLEMSREQVGKNFLAMDAMVEAEKIRKWEINEVEHDTLKKSFRRIKDYPICIVDEGGLTTAGLRARCRRLKHTENIGLVVIDYLQLMRPSSAKDVREQEVAEMSRDCKALARELDLPVIVVAQLNRSPEGRSDKRPVLSDLRESGSLEQDADVVMLLYRGDYYDETAEHGTAEVNIAKQRNGPTGRVKLTFQSKFLRFDNWVPECPAAQNRGR